LPAAVVAFDEFAAASSFPNDDDNGDSTRTASANNISNDPLFDLKQQILKGQADALVVMREWASTRTMEGAQKAEQLLLWLEQEQQRNLGTSPALPVITRQHYTIVLDAHVFRG
jgi:hypothetical protein